MEMLDSINYRFLRNVVSATPATQVQPVRMNLDDLNDLVKAQKLPMDHPLIQQISSDLETKHGRKLEKDESSG